MSVRKTAGGLFDPSRRGIMFGAGSPSLKVPQLYLVAVNDLYGDKGEESLTHLINEGHTVLLDSGIFNLTNEHKRETGCTMDAALSLAPDEINGFERLFDRYVEIAQRFGDRLWGYIELDQGGVVNKRKTRQRLHDLGLSPIPVYHPLNDGWDYFDELAQGYDRICYGNVVQANQTSRVRLLHTMWERHRQYPDLFIHLLGITANQWCVATPPDSCDSSSWINGLRYPALDLGYAYMARTRGRIVDPGFRYDMREVEPGTSPTVATMTHASQMYADEMDFLNMLWKRIRDDRAALGEDVCPPYLDNEGELCPATT